MMIGDDYCDDGEDDDADDDDSVDDGVGCDKMIKWQDDKIIR